MKTAKEVFKRGDRVRLTAEAIARGIQTRKNANVGTVVGYSFYDPENVRVLWDGCKTYAAYRWQSLERVEG